VAALPLFPLGSVLLPGADRPLVLFEPRYLDLLRRLAALPPDQRVFGVVALRRGGEVGPRAALDLHEVGCVARLTTMPGMMPGSRGVRIDTVGTRRFRLVRLDPHAGTTYHTGVVHWLPEPVGADPDRHAERVRRDTAAYRRWVGAAAVRLPEDPVDLSYAAADALVLDVAERQDLLAADSATERLALLARLLRRELTLLERLPSLPRTARDALPSPN